jgi:hypothetical protein
MLIILNISIILNKVKKITTNYRLKKNLAFEKKIIYNRIDIKLKTIEKKTQPKNSRKNIKLR